MAGQKQNQQRNDVHEEIRRQLKSLFDVYRAELTPEAIESYVITLDDLSVGDLKVAFPESMRRARTGFLPTPGEIRAALELVKANATRIGRLTNARSNCKLCDGTGYKIIEARNQKTGEIIPGYNQAMRCDCLHQKAG